MDGEAWWTTVHGITKNWTQLNTHTHTHATNQDLLYSTGNSAQSDVAGWMGREFWGEWIHVYIWPSGFVGHLNLSQHC